MNENALEKYTETFSEEEIKIYEALKKKLSSFYEIHTLLQNKKIKHTYCILLVKSEKKALKYIKNSECLKDVITMPIPYAENFFLVILQNSTIKDCILLGSRISSLINTQFLIQEKKRSEVKMSLIHIKDNPPLENVVFEILQSYKNLKFLSHLINNLWVEIKKL